MSGSHITFGIKACYSDFFGHVEEKNVFISTSGAVPICAGFPPKSIICYGMSFKVPGFFRCGKWRHHAQ